MDKREFDLKVKEIHEEVDRLSSIVEDPARILSEFYDAYKPNLLQKTLEFLGYAEDELYEVRHWSTARSHGPVISRCHLCGSVTAIHNLS